MILPKRALPRSAMVATLVWVAGGLGVIGLGCAPPAQVPKPCDVQIVTLDIYAADNINPNERGNPRPVVVRLYQLKSDVRMENATYDEIFLKDKEALGDDLAKADEVSVFPNDRVQVKFERMKEASALAGVALFHGPTGNSWKTLYTFPPIPAQAQGCGVREGDAGAPQSDPRAAFFLVSATIDNGTQWDESMFPDAKPIRKMNFPKKSAAPERPAGPVPANTASTP